MRTPDHDRIRSEKKRTLPEFLELYNEDLPVTFPRASTDLLQDFKKSHTSLFPPGKGWTLDQHRRKVMDWLRAHAV